MDTTNNISTTDEQVSNNAQPIPILRLPCDLQLMIFDHLNPIDSTCLGLTSKVLYPVYRRRFRNPLPLDKRVDMPPFRWGWGIHKRGIYSKPCPKCLNSKSCFLHHHIEAWFGEKRYYCFICRSFVYKPDENSGIQLCNEHLACYTEITDEIEEILEDCSAGYADAYMFLRCLRRI